MVYYSAITRNEVVIHGAKQTKLENIILTEENQTQKTTYLSYNTHYMKYPEQADPQRQKVSHWLLGPGKMRAWKMNANEHEVDDKNVLKLESGDSCTTL